VTARRRAPLLAAVLALLAVAAVAVLLLRGGDDRSPRSRAPGADPIAFVPAERADVALSLDTRDALVVLAAQQLIPRVSSLTPTQVTPLLGGLVAVATTPEGSHLAFSTDAPPPPGGRRARGRIVVVAPRPTALTPAPGARRRFDARFAGLPPAAGVRAAFRPQSLLPPAIANTRWGRSLRDGAAVVAEDLTVPFLIHADPTGIGPADPPIAPGATAPATHGQAPVVIGLRDPARGVRFARESGAVPGLDLVDRLPEFLRPHLDDLGVDGTLTMPTLGLERLTLRTEPRDPGDWATKLGRLEALSWIAKRVVGLAVEERDGVYTLLQDGRIVVRAAVYGRVLVLSTDPGADLRAAAAAPATPPPPGAAGGLTLRAAAAALGPGAPALLRAGTITGWARAEPTGVSGELRPALR
jgi:hypothetical protein